jgi:hypothetical protein
MENDTELKIQLINRISQLWHKLDNFLDRQETKVKQEKEEEMYIIPVFQKKS